MEGSIKSRWGNKGGSNREPGLKYNLQFFANESGSGTPNTGQGFSSKGYNPQSGERAIDGYVRNNANPEISLTTQSSGFNNNNGYTGGVFKRFGAESHGGFFHMYINHKEMLHPTEVFTAQ